MVGALILAGVLASQAVQSPPSPALAPGDVPVSIDRIQRALAQESALKLTDGTRFRVEIFGRRPTLAELLGPDFLKGPTLPPAAGMTHQEFLAMVTPPLAQPYGAFTGTDLLQVAITTMLQQWAVQKALDKLRAATTEREREQARREVDEAMDKLRKAREAAGLPHK
jgi:hypothetical protein